MIFNDYKKDENVRLNHMLPSYIIECGLNDKDFSPMKGGTFRCPVCQHKLGLYWDEKATPSRWSINTFGHCSHFGYNSEYPNDVTGIYMALSGENCTFDNLKAAKGRFLGSYTSDSSEFVEKKNKAEEFKKERNRKNVELVLKYGKWGNSIPQEGKTLLLKRGIDLNVLSDEIKESIGFIKSQRLYYLFDNPEGERYKYPVSAVLFALGSKENGEYVNFQGRKTTKDGEYEQNHKYRFLNIGQSNLFLEQNIDKLLENTTSSSLFITEGPFDCLSYQMVHGNAVSVQGAGNIEKIVAKLVEVLTKVEKATIYVDYDNDQVGNNSGENLIERLKAINSNVLIFRHPGFYEDCKDANDFLQKYRNSFNSQVSILKEIARQYKKDLITKKVAELWVAEMKNTKRNVWNQTVVEYLKQNSKNTEKEVLNEEMQKN